jgi:hypothetical protein
VVGLTRDESGINFPHAADQEQAAASAEADPSASMRDDQQEGNDEQKDNERQGLFLSTDLQCPVYPQLLLWKDFIRSYEATARFFQKHLN